MSSEKDKDAESVLPDGVPANNHSTDLRQLTKGVEALMGLDIAQIGTHYEKHPEDKLCDLPHPSGKGLVLCTRDAYEAIYSMAERHLSSLPNKDDYSLKDMAEAIRSRILVAARDETSDEAIIVRTLREATIQSQTEHYERTFHFPCVLVSSQVPQHFSVGPVRFTTLSAFLDLKKDPLDAYVDRNPYRQSAMVWVDRLKTNVSSNPWMASITIPPCAPSVSHLRAEQTAATAINLIRLLIGASHARDMRLVHSLSPSPLAYDVLVETNEELDIWSTRRVSGGLVEDDWQATLRARAPEFWVRAGHLLNASTQGQRSEIAGRMLDAISWFGEASLETIPGTQIAKFEAALERLTVTGPFKLHLFCSRVALLAYEREEEIEQCYWKAFNIHLARSQVVHGVISPKSAVFRKSLSLAHEVARVVLFRGLEIHRHLDHSGGGSTLETLQNFYNKLLSRHAALFSGLKKQLRAKQEAHR
jgi:hypothetical protein